MEFGIPPYSEAEKQVCKKICRFNKSQTHCIGCKRTLDEINEWHTYDLEKQKNITNQLVERIITD